MYFIHIITSFILFSLQIEAGGGTETIINQLKQEKVIKEPLGHPIIFWTYIVLFEKILYP